MCLQIRGDNVDIKILTVTLDNNKINRRDIPKIRGFLANKFPHYLEIHNHIGKEKFKYGYPLVQYKVIDEIPNIIGINEATKTILEVFHDIEEIDIKDAILEVYEKGYRVRKDAIGETDYLYRYKFITPWMALNQNNFNEYLRGSQTEQMELLKKIMIGNILSMSKYLGYRVEKPIQVFIKLEPLKVNFKNNAMTAFNGEFMTNFHIPDYLGIGKSVSRGFGTVKKIGVGTFY